MSIKVWNVGDVADGDSYAFSTVYTHTEAQDNNDIVKSSDFNRPLRNVYEIEWELYKLLELFTRDSAQPRGIFKGSLTSAFAFDGDTNKDTVTAGAGDTRHYARLTPGIACNNGQLVVIRPTTHIAERQLARAFNLEIDEKESVNIAYDYATDTYTAVIVKKDSNGDSSVHTFNNGGPGYDNAPKLLEAIYNDAGFQIAFNDAFAADLTNISLEPLVEISTGDTYYWIIDSDGNPQCQNTAGDSVDITITTFEVEIEPENAQIAVTSNQSDDRFYFQNYNDFGQYLNLNVPNTFGDSDTSDLDIADLTKITNQDAFLRFLRVSGDTQDHTLLGWAENEIDDADSIVPPGKSQMFYLNKDMIIKFGSGDSDWTQISSLHASAQSGNFPVVALYTDLPPSASDGTLYFVRETNQFYRYSSNSNGWIPVSDPYKQYTTQPNTKLGSAYDAGDSGIYIFSGASWKLDGSNLFLYVNGNYQVLNTGSDSYDFRIVNHNTVEFNSTSQPEVDQYVTAVVVDGGSNYYPDKETYIVGDSDGSYLGDTIEFPTNMEPVKQTVDVLRNGVMQRESELIATITGDTVSEDKITVYKTSDGITIGDTWIGYYVEATLGNNLGAVRRIASVLGGDSFTVGDSFGDSTTADDTYSIYRDYDYFVDEALDKILFESGLNAGEFVEISERAAIVSNDNDGIGQGDTFPSNPNFGYEFYLKIDGDSGWYKYGDVSSGWVKISA